MQDGRTRLIQVELLVHPCMCPVQATRGLPCLGAMGLVRMTWLAFREAKDARPGNVNVIAFLRGSLKTNSAGNWPKQLRQPASNQGDRWGWGVSVSYSHAVSRGKAGAGTLYLLRQITVRYGDVP